MTNKKLLVLILLFGSGEVFSQLQSFDVASTGVGSTGYVRFNNPSEIGQKQSNTIEFSDVRGSCFWNDDWMPALLVLKNGNGVKMQGVKLNLYKNDVHYLFKGAELVALPGTVNRLIFYDKKDTSKVAGIFQLAPNVLLNSESGFSYLEMLNTGKNRLMKKIKVSLVERDKDTMSGKVTYKFSTQNSYYVLVEGTFRQLKNLNKNSLFGVIKPIDSSEKWLSDKKNKLKSEQDIVAYLDFLDGVK